MAFVWWKPPVVRKDFDIQEKRQESRDLIPLDLDDDAGDWQPVSTVYETLLVTAFVLAVFAAGFCVGMLWPLE